MNSHWLLCLSALVAPIVTCGCGGSGPPPAGEPHEKWTALRDLQMDGLMIIGQDASMGNWAAVRKGASSEPFQQAVDAFTSSSLPPELAAHQGLKTQFDEGLKGIIASAKSGGDSKALEENYNKAMEAMKALNAELQGHN